MFTVKDREKPQNGLTSAMKNRDSHTSSMQPTWQPLDSLQVLQRNLSNSYLQAISETETQRHDDQQKLQTKLVVGSPGDVYEQEADRVAEQVMRMPEPTVSNEEEEEILQPKELPGHIPEAIPDLETRIQSQRGSGQPLPTSVRAFFEPRFGHDFNSVRIHTDPNSDQLNRTLDARAFTSGQDIFFCQGEYNPDGSRGKELLAHELTHVVQQSGGVQRELTVGQQGDKHEQQASWIVNKMIPISHVQRKIAADFGIDLTSYFNNRGIVGVTKTANTYTHPSPSYSSIETEILGDMLKSPTRTFNVDSDNQTIAEMNLDDHVKARKGIVDFASKRQYGFGAGEEMKMNPEYFTCDEEGCDLKPGVDPMIAMNDVNVHSNEYKIACHMAAKITMEAGSGTQDIVRDEGVPGGDWVPGDWGYIENDKFKVKPVVGREGENIIYTGLGQYWGHSGSLNPYKTLEGWQNHVYDWNHGVCLKDHRRYPRTGLLGSS